VQIRRGEFAPDTSTTLVCPRRISVTSSHTKPRRNRHFQLLRLDTGRSRSQLIPPTSLITSCPLFSKPVPSVRPVVSVQLRERDPPLPLRRHRSRRSEPSLPDMSFRSPSRSVLSPRPSSTDYARPVLSVPRQVKPVRRVMARLLHPMSHRHIWSRHAPARTAQVSSPPTCRFLANLVLAISHPNDLPNLVLVNSTLSRPPRLVPPRPRCPCPHRPDMSYPVCANLIITPTWRASCRPTHPRSTDYPSPVQSSRFMPKTTDESSQPVPNPERVLSTHFFFDNPVLYETNPAQSTPTSPLASFLFPVRLLSRLVSAD